MGRRHNTLKTRAHQFGGYGRDGPRLDECAIEAVHSAIKSGNAGEIIIARRGTYRAVRHLVSGVRWMMDGGEALPAEAIEAMEVLKGRT